VASLLAGPSAGAQEDLELARSAALPMQARSRSVDFRSSSSPPSTRGVVWRVYLDSQHGDSRELWARVTVEEDFGSTPWTLVLESRGGSVQVPGRELPNGQPVWMQPVPGSRAQLSILASEEPRGLVLRVDRIGYTAERLGIEAIVDPAHPRIEPLERYRGHPTIGPAAESVARLDSWFDPPAAGWSDEVVRVLRWNARESTLVPCTGFLISESRLATASHCLPRPLEQGAPCRGTVAFFGADSDAARAKSYRCQRVIARSNAEDVAVLELEGLPGRDWRVPPLRVQAAVAGEETFIVHHPGGRFGRAKKVTLGRCAVACVAWETGAARCPSSLPVPPDDFLHDCDTDGGSSGSPVFSSRGELIGVHHQGFTVRDVPGVPLLNYAVNLGRALSVLGVAPGAGP
jgi:V8-like Glu-specific endopeptidase